MRDSATTDNRRARWHNKMKPLRAEVSLRPSSRRRRLLPPAPVRRSVFAPTNPPVLPAWPRAWLTSSRSPFLFPLPHPLSPSRPRHLSFARQRRLVPNEYLWRAVHIDTPCCWVANSAPRLVGSSGSVVARLHRLAKRAVRPALTVSHAFAQQREQPLTTFTGRSGDLITPVFCLVVVVVVAVAKKATSGRTQRGEICVAARQPVCG